MGVIQDAFDAAFPDAVPKVPADARALGGVIDTALFPLDGIVTPEMFGAVGDGTTDDSAAFVAMMNAFPDRMGFTCYLGAKTYKISSAALYFTRRIKLIGVSRTVTILDFSASTEVVNAPYNCHIITVHSNNINTGGNPDRITLPGGQVGTYGEMSGLQNLTVNCNPNIVDGIGVFFNVACDAKNIIVHQANLHCIVVAGTANNFQTRGDTVGPSGLSVRGNSNNGVYYNIKATGAVNGDGIHVTGSDANANLFDHADANTCKGWGINDASLLGNTYVQPHTSANAYGAYRSRPASTNRSVYICPYAEGNQGAENPGGYLWEMSARALIFGADGVLPDNHGDIRAISAENAGFVFRTQLNVMDAADTADIGGAYSRVGKGFFEMQSDDGQKIELKRFSSSFSALYHNGQTVILFRNTNSGAIQSNRPHLLNGFSISTSHGQTAASAEPSSGTYQAGNVIWDEAATAGGTAGWVCTTGGTAGSTAVFKTFGTIEA